MTTLDEAMAYAAHEIDTLIERYLKAHEALIRHDIAVTGPEDEEALDRAGARFRTPPRRGRHDRAVPMPQNERDAVASVIWLQLLIFALVLFGLLTR